MDSDEYEETLEEIYSYTPDEEICNTVPENNAVR